MSQLSSHQQGCGGTLLRMSAPKSWIALHAAFAAVAVAVLLLPLGPTGIKVLVLVIGYNVAVAVTARLTHDEILWRMWAVLAPMSALMILPDWFLGAVVGSISFPNTGSPFIGTMPLFMAFMWTIALLPICLLGYWTEARRGQNAGFIAAAVAGLALFIAAEWLAPEIPLWQPVGVVKILGVAVYVLLPELALCVATYALVRVPHPPPVTLGGIVAIPFMYLGMLATCYQFLG